MRVQQAKTSATPRLRRGSPHRQRRSASVRRHYNYFRDYEPGTGRYVESDPIGLDGGISTFGYVAGSPLKYADPTGLDYWVEGGVDTEGGGRLHQSVCVGKRGTSNRFCISFGVNEPECLMNCKGMVYHDGSGEGPLVNIGVSTSAQDSEIRRSMVSQVGSDGRYFVLGNNCRDFSKSFFKELERKYGGYVGSH